MESSSEQLKKMGQRLKQTRLALGMKQPEFGKILGIEPNSLSSWESGKRTINPLALTRLCKQYRITTDWIYLGDPSGLPYHLAQKLLGQTSVSSSEKTDETKAG